MLDNLVNLATYYRPRTFSEIKGQGIAVSVVKTIASAEGIACRSLFLKGSYGSGKTCLCRMLGKAMNCSEFKKTGEVCNECDGCKEVSKSNSQLYYEFDASSVGNVEGIKSIKELLLIPPKGRRVVVFDEIHAASKAALNALLKVVEEGVKDTLFVFASTESILPTLESRSICVDILPLSETEISERVLEVANDRKIEINQQQLHLIAIKSKGHMRNALSILQLFELTGDEALKTSFKEVREFLYSCISKSRRCNALSIIPSVMKYPNVDIKDSIYQVIKSIFVATDGVELMLKKANYAEKMFTFFMSTAALNALKSETGTELLLRSFYEQTAK